MDYGIILNYKSVCVLMYHYKRTISTILNSIYNYEEYELNCPNCNYSKRLFNFKNVAISLKTTANYYRQIYVRDMDHAMTADIAKAYQKHNRELFIESNRVSVKFDFINICESRQKTLKAISLYSNICNNIDEIKNHYDKINNHIVNNLESSFNEKIDAYSRCRHLLNYNFRKLAQDFKELYMLSNVNKYIDKTDYYHFDPIKCFNLDDSIRLFNDEDNIPF